MKQGGEGKSLRFESIMGWFLLNGLADWDKSCGSTHSQVDATTSDR